MSKEPSVTVQMVTDTYINTAVSGQNIAGGVIIADCGTLEPKLFYSSTEVLKEFTKTGSITRNTDSTLIHAAAIADIMPVFLKRTYNDDGTRAGFGIYKNLIPNENVLNLLLTGFTSITPNVFQDILEGTTIIGSISANGSDLQASSDGIKCNTITYLSRSKFNKIVVTPNYNLSVFDLSKFRYAYLTDTLGEETYLSPSQVSYNNSTGELSIDCDDMPANTYITLVFTEDIVLSQIDSIFQDPISYTECYIKNDVVLKYVQDMIMYVSELDPINFVLGVNDKVYYNASVAAPNLPGYSLVPVEGLTRYSTARNIVDAINKLNSDLYIEFDGTNYRVFSVNALDAMPRDTDNIIDNSTDASIPAVSSAGGGFSIILWSRYPSSVNFLGKVNKSTSNEDLIEVTVSTANRIYEYTGSTDPEYVNEYGVNQYIGNINEYSGIPFQIEVVKDRNGAFTKSSEILDTPTIEFGGMHVNDSKDLSVRKAALDVLCDQDEVKIAFLCPFGYANNGYLAKMATYTTKIWAFMPVGMYAYSNDPEALIARRPNLSTEYAMIMAPHDKSTLMTDWVVDMSLEVAYLSKITSNAAKSCEFAPMMGKDNSTLTLTKPSVRFTKSTRKRLLDARIMSVISRTSEGVNYINKNQCSGGNTILAEDQNARLACKINRDLDTLLEPIIGRFNTEETRNRVLSIINNYFTNNITNQVFSIDSYRPICDESNNPPNIRANNQLVVDLEVVYLNAIWEVVVYHRALDVAAANNQ